MAPFLQPVVLFVVLTECKVVVTFQCLGQILYCDYVGESSFEALSIGNVLQLYLAILYLSKVIFWKACSFWNLHAFQSKRMKIKMTE